MKNVKTWFWVSIGAALLHFGDNIARLDLYPDLPMTKASSIAFYGIVMFAVGFLGYWLFLVRAQSIGKWLLFKFILMNFVVLGHYLPSRLTRGFWGYGLEVHLFIWLEVLASLVLLYYLSKSVKNIKQP